MQGHNEEPRLLLAPRRHPCRLRAEECPGSTDMMLCRGQSLPGAPLHPPTPGEASGWCVGLGAGLQSKSSCHHQALEACPLPPAQFSTLCFSYLLCQAAGSSPPWRPALCDAEVQYPVQHRPLLGAETRAVRAGPQRWRARVLVPAPGKPGGSWAGDVTPPPFCVLNCGGEVLATPPS